MGFFLTLFLIEHLLTNSEAALWIGEDGHGFIRMVNFIHSLPYLPVIEIVLIATPLFIHIVWGVKYLLSAEPNSLSRNDGSVSLPGYARNQLYTLQRISSWLLIIGVLAHVGHMRFGLVPNEIHHEGEEKYLTAISLDEGLYTVSARLDIQLYDQAAIATAETRLQEMKLPPVPSAMVNSSGIDKERANYLLAKQEKEQQKAWVEMLKSYSIEADEVVASAPSTGAAWLLTVRDTFKRPLMIGLYSVFVITACFHAFNGLWTFCITWGIALTERSQQLMRYACIGLTLLTMGLGLIAIWGTYFLNLYA